MSDLGLDGVGGGVGAALALSAIAAIAAIAAMVSLSLPSRCLCYRAFLPSYCPADAIPTTTASLAGSSAGGLTSAWSFGIAPCHESRSLSSRLLVFGSPFTHCYELHPFIQCCLEFALSFWRYTVPLGAALSYTTTLSSRHATTHHTLSRLAVLYSTISSKFSCSIHFPFHLLPHQLNSFSFRPFSSSIPSYPVIMASSSANFLPRKKVPMSPSSRSKCFACPKS